ncbi:MAG: hypothetical protein ACRDHI_09420 [Actinomycetota bacterium]
MIGTFGTLVVLAAAVAVGVLVYRLTAGAGDTEGAEDAGPGSGDVSEWSGEEGKAGRAGGALAAPASAGAPERGGTTVSERPSIPDGYIPVAPASPSWHARLGGLMGLLIAVGAGAIALALSLYAIGSLIARLVSGT